MMANAFCIFHLLLLHHTISQYCPLNRISRYHAADAITDNLYCNSDTSTTSLGACTDAAFPGIGGYTLQENPKFYLYSSTTGHCALWSTDITMYVGVMISGSDRDTLISSDYNEVNTHCNRANCVYTLGYCSSIDPGDGYHAPLYRLYWSDMTDHFYTTEINEIASVAPPYVEETSSSPVCYVRTATIPPTNDPTQSPTTKIPTQNPTKYPTKHPTKNPSKFPTQNPTKNPTKFPTTIPTSHPTKSPTMQPISTDNPSKSPSQNPSKYATYIPTTSPSIAPTFSGGFGVHESTKNRLSLTQSVKLVRNEESFFDGQLSLIIYVLIGLISVCCIGLVVIICCFVRRKNNKQNVQEYDVENAHGSGYVLETSPTMTASPTMNSSKIGEEMKDIDSTEIMMTTHTKRNKIERLYSNDENQTDEDMDELYTENATKGGETEGNENENVLNEEYEPDDNGNVYDLYTKGGVNVTAKDESNHEENNYDQMYVKSQKTETMGFTD